MNDSNTTYQHINAADPKQKDLKLFASYAVTTSYIALNTAICITNTIHLITLVRNKGLFRFSRNHRFFLIMLAIFDLMLGFFRLIATNQLSQQAMSDHNWLCVLSQIIIQGLMISSFGLILLTAVDRVLATKGFYEECWFVRHFRAENMLFCLITFAVYGGIAIAWHDTGAYKVKGIASCDIRRKERITIIMAWGIHLLTLVASAIMIYSYRGYVRNKATGKGGRIARKKLKLVKVLFYLLLLHVAMLMITTTSAFMKGLPSWWWFRYVCSFGLSMNPLLDPIVFGAASKNYRTILGTMCRKKKCEQRQPMSLVTLEIK